MTSTFDIEGALQGRYHVLERIGSGGFSEVFKARQTATGQAVAVKTLRVDPATEDSAPGEALERFRQEMRLCAELQHPNIVRLLDWAEADGGVCAVFAYVPGWNLDDVLGAEGALPPAEAVHLMGQVLDGLSSAHAQGIVHRDLKPANVMVTATGARRNAMLLDFGLGLLLGAPGRSADKRLTLAGGYLGTPHYSAPEQFRGQTASALTDLYAWGLVLLECLTGEPPWGARTPQEAIHCHLSPEPVPLPEALEDHALGELLRRVTSKDPEDRRIDVGEALAALERCVHEGLPRLDGAGPAGGRARGHPSGPRGEAGSSRLGPLFLVPLARNPNFTGREDLLDSVGELLERHNLLSVVALQGMGGIGKTQAALEYTYRSADRYRLVAWIRAERLETLAADYGAIGNPLGLSATPDQQHRIEAVRAWLESHDGWLIVFDNATDPAALRPFLPRQHAGHVLVTSRNASWRGLAASLDVPVLDPDAGASFLAARTGDEDAGAARTLWDELGGLPLALEDAAAYIEGTGCSITTYLGHLRQHRERLLLGEREASGTGTLRTAWELSFQQVDREAPRACDLLALAAHLAPDDIPRALLVAGADELPEGLREVARDELALDAAIAALRRYSLVRVERDHLAMHRLVQLAVRERLGDEERSRWARIALRAVERAYPHGSLAGAYEPDSGRYLSHAVAVLGHAEDQPEVRDASARLLRRTGIYRSARGEHERAARDLERALELAEGSERPDQEQIAVVLWELAMVNYVTGEVDAARGQLERCIAWYDANGRDSSLEMAAPLLTRAWVQRSQGEFRESLLSAERALHITESVLGVDNAFNSLSAVIIARAHWSAGRVAEALGVADRAYALLAGRDLHPMASGTFYQLAQVLLDLGDPRRARDCAERGLAISEKAYGPNHPFVSANSAVLGAAWLQLGEHAAARPCLERAFEAGERICRLPHEDFRIARSELARLQLREGERDEARRTVARALSLANLVCGDASRTESCAHLAAAELELDAADAEAARRHAGESLRITNKSLGAGHAASMPALRALAGVARLRGDRAEAEERLQEALAIGETRGLGEHPAVAELLAERSALRAATGAREQARRDLADAHAMLVACLGADSPAAAGLARRLAAF